MKRNDSGQREMVVIMNPPFFKDGLSESLAILNSLARDKAFG